MTKVIKQIYIFRNGNVAVFDNDDKQVPEMQINMKELLHELAERNGCELTDDTSIQWR